MLIEDRAHASGCTKDWSTPPWHHQARARNRTTTKRRKS
jgi:hypothetical protein